VNHDLKQVNPFQIAIQSHLFIAANPEIIVRNKLEKTTGNQKSFNFVTFAG